MSGVLLDTHALYWLNERSFLSGSAEIAIAQAQARDRLFVSPITAWEVGTASRKKKNPMFLHGLQPNEWMEEALRDVRARLAAITTSISLEAAQLPGLYDSGDPGDCFLIATAHVRKLTLITRDRPILKFAARTPGYISVIAC